VEIYGSPVEIEEKERRGSGRKRDGASIQCVCLYTNEPVILGSCAGT